MMNRAPFKHKQGGPGGAPGKKLQGRLNDGGGVGLREQIDGGEGVRAPFFNFAPGRHN